MTFRRISVAVLLLGCTLPASAQAPVGPPPQELLESLHMLVAIVQYCNIDVPHDAAIRIAAAGRMLELNLGITRDQADLEYLRLKEVVAASPPDCSPDGSLMTAIDSQLGLDR